MKKLIDFTGRVFTRLTALYVSRSVHGRHGKTWWMCRCICGRRKEVRADHLKSGMSKSCGCLAIEENTTHGFSRTPEYRAYRSAKQRCNTPNHKSWKCYGGRGIKFLFTSFEQFFAELGKRPKGKSLDRKNNNGNYEPGNIRWATWKQQANNRRVPRLCPRHTEEAAPCPTQNTTHSLMNPQA